MPHWCPVRDSGNQGRVQSRVKVLQMVALAWSAGELWKVKKCLSFIFIPGRRAAHSYSYALSHWLRATWGVGTLTPRCFQIFASVGKGSSSSLRTHELCTGTGTWKKREMDGAENMVKRDSRESGWGRNINSQRVSISWLQGGLCCYCLCWCL